MADKTNPAGTAARIGAYLYRRRKSAQTDYENIHSYDAGCATEAMLLSSDIEAVLSALTRANAATAAAYEVAAMEAELWDGNILAYKIRALATPDQTAALDKLIAEAVEPYLEALIWCSGSLDFNEGGIARKGWQKLCAPLILAASKKGAP